MCLEKEKLVKCLKVNFTKLQEVRVHSAVMLRFWNVLMQQKTML